MAFLDNDEFIILMDIASINDLSQPGIYLDKPYGRYKHISRSELKMLFDAGIKTTMPFQNIWSETETSPGVYDWTYLDTYVEQANNIGMKTMLFTNTHGFPKWFPEDYFPVDENKIVHREALSPWNQEALSKNLEFIRVVMERYSSKENLVISSQLNCGETAFLNIPAFYDKHAIKSFQEYSKSDRIPNKNDPEINHWYYASLLSMILDQQMLLAQNQHNEIYTAMHPAIADMKYWGNGNCYIDQFLIELTKNIPQVKINHFYYTWVQWGTYWKKMSDWGNRFSENIFGGAEYAEGLPKTTPLAIQNGLRGQIMAPCYPTMHDHVETWMCDNIVASINLFKQKKEVK